MKQNVKSFIKRCTLYFYHFIYATGLCQGGNVTIVIFLLVEDSELYLRDNSNSGLKINDIVLICIFFVDVMTFWENLMKKLKTFEFSSFILHILDSQGY